MVSSRFVKLYGNKSICYRASELRCWVEIRLGDGHFGRTKESFAAIAIFSVGAVAVLRRNGVLTKRQFQRLERAVQTIIMGLILANDLYLVICQLFSRSWRLCNSLNLDLSIHGNAE